MAGRFKGKVGKLTKAKVSASTKKSRSKKNVSLVKRSPKLAETSLASRIAALTSVSDQAQVAGDGPSSHVKEKVGPNSVVMSLKKKKERTPQVITEKRIGRAALEVVREKSSSVDSEAKNSRSAKKAKRDEAADSSDEEGVPTHRAQTVLTERVVPTRSVDAPAAARSATEAVGLKLLHQALKTQGHKRLLPFQQLHDYEYRLRQVATMGVVRVFQSLAAARKAGAAVTEENNSLEDENRKHWTEEKVIERKEAISKEAFLAALRQGGPSRTSL